jgi:hypothetical protein
MPKQIFSAKGIKNSHKKAVLEGLFPSILMYGCKPWSLQMRILNSLQLFHNKCVRANNRSYVQDVNVACRQCTRAHSHSGQHRVWSRVNCNWSQSNFTWPGADSDRQECQETRAASPRLSCPGLTCSFPHGLTGMASVRNQRTLATH